MDVLLFLKRKIVQKSLQRHGILNEDNLVLFIRYVYNFEAFIFREIELLLFFFCSSFFGRGQLIKSGLQRYQILNEGNLN